MQTQTDYSSENQPNSLQQRSSKEDCYSHHRHSSKREPFNPIDTNNSPSRQQLSAKQVTPVKPIKSSLPADKKSTSHRDQI